MIRRASPTDIPTLLSWARARYGVLDDVAAVRWVKDGMENPDHLVLRGERTCAIAVIAEPPWGGAARCHMIALFGAPTRGLGRAGFRESVELLRHIDLWRQARGVDSFHFGAETGARFAVLAKALGAKQDPPSFTLGGTPMSFAAEMFRRPAPQEVRARAPRSALEQVLGV